MCVCVGVCDSIQLDGWAALGATYKGKVNAGVDTVQHERSPRVTGTKGLPQGARPAPVPPQYALLNVIQRELVATHLVGNLGREGGELPARSATTTMCLCACSVCV